MKIQESSLSYSAPLGKQLGIEPFISDPGSFCFLLDLFESLAFVLVQYCTVCVVIKVTLIHSMYSGSTFTGQVMNSPKNK